MPGEVTIHQIAGTYAEVAEANSVNDVNFLSLHDPNSQQQIAKDISRTALMASNSLEAGIWNARWQNTTMLNFAQGNMDARTFNFFVTLYGEIHSSDDENFFEANNSKSFAFAYIDQNGLCCGLSLEKKVRSGEWILSIIRNTDALELEDRQVVIWHSGFKCDVVKPGNAEKSSVAPQELQNQLSQAIQSEPIYQLISPLFNQGLMLQEDYLDQLILKIDSKSNYANTRYHRIDSEGNLQCEDIGDELIFVELRQTIKLLVDKVQQAITEDNSKTVILVLVKLAECVERCLSDIGDDDLPKLLQQIMLNYVKPVLDNQSLLEAVYSVVYSNDFTRTTNRSGVEKIKKAFMILAHVIDLQEAQIDDTNSDAYTPIKAFINSDVARYENLSLQVDALNREIRLSANKCSLASDKETVLKCAEENEKSAESFFSGEKTLDSLVDFSHELSRNVMQTQWALTMGVRENISQLLAKITRAIRALFKKEPEKNAKKINRQDVRQSFTFFNKEVRKVIVNQLCEENQAFLQNMKLRA